MSVPITTPPLKVHPLLSEAEIAVIINRLAGEIAAGMPKEFTCIALMDGAFVFAADLMRALHKRGVNPKFESISLSSYGDERESSGQVTIYFDRARRYDGQSVLIIDDVLETGLTLETAIRMVKDRGAAHVKTCVFAQKPSSAHAVISANYIGWHAPDKFLVGYGLDDAGLYRGLPYVGVAQD